MVTSGALQLEVKVHLENGRAKRNAFKCFMKILTSVSFWRLQMQLAVKIYQTEKSCVYSFISISASLFFNNLLSFSCKQLTLHFRVNN